MAKKTVRPDPPSAPTSPNRRRAPATGRRTAARRASTPGESTLAAAATAIDQPPPIDSATDRRGAGNVDSAAGRTPTYEEIAEAAYRRYLERGGHDGQDFDDWLEAERSLRSRR